MSCADIALQGFDRSRGKIVDISLSSILAKSTSATGSESEVTIATAGEDMDVLGPGTYILSDPAPETLAVGIGPQFNKLSGQFHASVLLNNQYLEIVNKTGITIVFSVAIFTNGNTSITNSTGTSSNGDPIIVFSGSTLTYAEMNLYLYSTGVDSSIMTGTISIIPSVTVNQSLAAEKTLMTNIDYPTINLDNGSSTYIIDNSGLDGSTYITIIGRPSQYTTVGMTVYSGGPVYMLNSTGSAMIMGLRVDGTLYKGTLSGGVFPGFPISSSFTSTARFSPLVDSTGNITSIATDIDVSTSTSVIPFNGSDGSLTGIDVNGPTVVVGNIDNTYYNAPSANTIILDPSIKDAIAISTAVYYGGGSIQFVNNTNVPVTFVSYATITNSPYLTLAPGSSGTPPDMQGTSGVVGMKIISGDVAGIAIYYQSMGAISSPPMVYVGSNISGNMVPDVDGTSSTKNVMISGSELYNAHIPIDTPYSYTLLYVGSKTQPQLFNFSTLPVNVQYYSLVQTVPPSTAMAMDPLLVGAVSVVDIGGSKQVMDSGVPIVLLGETGYDIYLNNFDRTSGTYSPTMDSLKVPISTQSYNGDVTIVIPPLSNTLPIIMTVFRGPYDVRILNNTGYVLSISSSSAGQNTPDVITVNVGDTFTLPSAYMTSMYIPPAGSNPLQIVTYSNV